MRPSPSVLLILLTLSSLCGMAAEGYAFLKGTSHTSIRFEMYKNLIVIPAKLNDSINVKLILDTGTRSLLLYGKRFKNIHNLSAGRRLKVAGWGSPNGVDAQVSFPNNIVIGRIHGDSLGVAVVSSRKLFEDRFDIDGIIGYELFVRFVVEINYRKRMIHLFEKLPIDHTAEFTVLPLEINKAMPQVYSTIVLTNKKSVSMRLLVDTGSSLGLTVFSKDEFAPPSGQQPRMVGIGLNGIIKGVDLYLQKFFLGELRVKPGSAHVVNVEEHPDNKFSYCGSLGAAFLKKHIVIFDYPSSRMFLLSYKDRSPHRRSITDEYPTAALL